VEIAELASAASPSGVEMVPMTGELVGPIEVSGLEVEKSLLEVPACDTRVSLAAWRLIDQMV
jgi:hypothetical protein